MQVVLALIDCTDHASSKYVCVRKLVVDYVGKYSAYRGQNPTKTLYMALEMTLWRTSTARRFGSGTAVLGR